MKSSSTVLIYCYQSRAIMMIYTFCCQNELKEVGVTKSEVGQSGEQARDLQASEEAESRETLRLGGASFF